jgi:hypothetical protein
MNSLLPVGTRRGLSGSLRPTLRVVKGGPIAAIGLAGIRRGADGQGAEPLRDSSSRQSLREVWFNESEWGPGELWTGERRAGEPFSPGHPAT